MMICFNPTTTLSYGSFHFISKATKIVVFYVLFLILASLPTDLLGFLNRNSFITVNSIFEILENDVRKLEFAERRIGGSFFSYAAANTILTKNQSMEATESPELEIGAIKSMDPKDEEQIITPLWDQSEIPWRLSGSHSSAAVSNVFVDPNIVVFYANKLLQPIFCRGATIPVASSTSKFSNVKNGKTITGSEFASLSSFDRADFAFVRGSGEFRCICPKGSYEVFFPEENSMRCFESNPVCKIKPPSSVAEGEYFILDLTKEDKGSDTLVPLEFKLEVLCNQAVDIPLRSGVLLVFPARSFKPGRIYVYALPLLYGQIPATGTFEEYASVATFMTNSVESSKDPLNNNAEVSSSPSEEISRDSQVQLETSITFPTSTIDPELRLYSYIDFSKNKAFKCSISLYESDTKQVIMSKGSSDSRIENIELELHKTYLMTVKTQITPFSVPTAGNILRSEFHMAKKNQFPFDVLNSVAILLQTDTQNTDMNLYEDKVISMGLSHVSQAGIIFFTTLVFGILGYFFFDFCFNRPRKSLEKSFTKKAD